MDTGPQRTGKVGRVARLVLGVGLTIIALPVYFEAGREYILASLALALGLVAFYTAVHLALSPLLARLNRWIGAIVVVAPVLLVWYFGQGGGPLFGEGEGGTAAITFLAVSFFVDFARGSAGCEVMALPGLLFGKRANLPCLLLFPIDDAEAARQRNVAS